MENTLLNLIPAAYLPEIHLSQYDVGRTITFTLKDGASDYSVPSGASVKVKATKPSGFGFEVACTFNGGTVTLVTTDTMTPENGRFPAELSIVSGNTTIGTSNFIFNIERSPHPEGTIDGDAESLLPELTLLVERIEAAADSVDEDTQTVTEAKAEVLQAKADTLQAKADTLTARDDALQAKADAITAKESAEASAQAAAESAQRAEDTLSEYAKVDGYYDEFTAGSAEQLLSSQFVEDSVPYKFRTSGGSKDIGNREYDEIVGGTVAWNQLIPIAGSSKTKTESNVTITDNRDGSYTVQTTQDGASADVNLTLTGAVTSKGGHVGILYGCPSGGYVNNSVKYRLWDAWGGIGNDYGKGNVGKWTAGGQFEIRISVASGTVITTPIKFVPQLLDLTAMFGSQIADRIYSLETAQSGKGVALFKSLFPNDYYPYNAGELLSVEGLQSHDTVGFNQWDEEWKVVGDHISSKNYIPVLPNTAYYWNAPVQPSNGFQFYDENKNKIGGTVYSFSGTGNIFTTPSNCHFVAFSLSSSYGTTYKNDICINLSWSGWRNGEYEPYKKHSYPLDSSLTLRGIPNLDSSNNLYYRGDTYEHDGTVTRWCRTVELGSSDWIYNSTYNVFYTSLGVNPEPSEATGGAYAMLPNYPYTPNFVMDSTKDKCCEIGRSGYFINMLIVRDTSYSDVASFKASMNGVYAIYKLATPTTEEAEPYTSPQAVDDFGTEEYISGNVVPVGHNTQYPANLRDKLQHLPNMADSDGAYLIRQTNKQMSLEVFRIPKAPTTDGTYILKATVSGGTPTYIWEAVE